MRTPLLQKHQDGLTAIHHDDGGKESILRCLAYFDIFRFPLTLDELNKFMDYSAQPEEIKKWVGALLQKGIIYQHQDLYSLQDNPLVVHRRAKGAERAIGLLKKAGKVGRFLYKFPFVRGVAVSGSLSKNFAEEKADIDFFVITKTNRLWVARTFMHLFKKLTYLAGQQHFYCMNYYIDESALLLEEQNVFTAIELKTLLPIAGRQATEHFFSCNKWADQWLPSCEFRAQSEKDPGQNLLKRFFEWMLNNRLGNRIDSWLLKITDRRWKRKKEAGKKNDKGMILNLITDRHFAKSDAGNFQANVLRQFEIKVSQLIS